MFSRTVLVLLLSLLLVSGSADPPAVTAAAKQKPKEIAITFDQLPVAESFKPLDQEVVTEKLLSALDKYKVKAAGFVVGSQIESNFDLLGQWLNRGHLLGNLTYSHQSLNAVSIEQFIKDIAAGADALEPMLSGFGQKARYFRYPFLQYGDEIVPKREVALYLEAQGYMVVPATVIVEDYLYDLSFQKLGDHPDTSDYLALKHQYLTHVLDEVARCEELSLLMLDRPCRQILLLRVNRLNAEFLEDLLGILVEDGYRFVSLEYALQDELYVKEEAYYGARGVGYLDMLYLSDPDLLPAE